MSHKTLIGGTAYNITGGKTLVGGTAYSISKGRTQVGGTDYDISFSPTPYAMLYTDGNMVFQYGSSVESGKTLRKSYKGFEDAEYSSYSSIPWYSNRMYINNVNFKDVISPFSMSYWFYNSINLTTFNYLNLDLDSIINMNNTFYNCINLTGSPICGDKVTDMFYTYFNCYNLTGSPVCGNNVTNMGGTYYSCNKITGDPVCGNNVTNMYITYFNCQNLTGSPTCGDNVTNMCHAYYNCRKLTGSPVCGNKVTDMNRAYSSCTKLTGNPVCGNNVTNMSSTYNACFNITGSPVCGENVINMSGAYYDCSNLTGSPVCGNNVTNMSATYYNCVNLTGSPACGNNVTNMFLTYRNCPNLYGDSYFYSNNVSTVRNCFTGRNTSNILNIYVHNGSVTMNTCLYNNTISFVGSSIAWTHDATNNRYYNTKYNIYIYPVINVFEAYKNKIINMLIDFTYTENENSTFTIIDWKKTLNGIPSTECIIPEHEIIRYKVMNFKKHPEITKLVIPSAYVTNTDFSNTFNNMINLKNCKIPYEKITNMSNMYANCYNLTDYPVCGNNVTNMSYAYYNCYNLTGSPVCSNNVTNMSGTYANCYNLYGNAYFYSNSVNNAYHCFTGRNTSNRLNIYVHNGSTTMNALFINNASSIVGDTVTWTNNGTCHYNTYYNTYIYPVANVAEAYEAEKEALRQSLIDFTYTENADGTFTLIGWKQTLNGVSSTKMVIPNDSRIKLT